MQERAGEIVPSSGGGIPFPANRVNCGGGNPRWRSGACSGNTTHRRDPEMRQLLQHSTHHTRGSRAFERSSSEPCHGRLRGLSRLASLAFTPVRERRKAGTGDVESRRKVLNCSTGKNSSCHFCLLTLNLKIFLPSHVCERDVPDEGHQAVPLAPDPLLLLASDTVPTQLGCSRKRTRAVGRG